MQSDRENHGALISVVVTAFNRTDYIDRALQSVRAQTVDLLSVEVILVANFNYNLKWPSPFNRFLSIQSEGSIGEYLSDALKNSSGQIIAFLDDDDVWEKTKLAYILQEFRADTTLIYIHNATKYINDLNNEIKSSRLSDSKFSKHSSKCIKMSNADIQRCLKRVLSTGGDFNLSSISIHRKIVENALPYLQQISGGTDTFFFWLSLFSEGNLLNTPNVITEYGLHMYNASRASSSEAKVLELKRIINTYYVISHFINREFVKINSQLGLEWLNKLISQYELLILVFSQASKSIIFRNLRHLLFSSPHFHYSSTRRIILFTFFHLIFPKLTNKVYFKFLENTGR